MTMQEPIQQPLGRVSATFLEEDDFSYHSVSRLRRLHNCFFCSCSASNRCPAWLSWSNDQNSVWGRGRGGGLVCCWQRRGVGV